MEFLNFLVTGNGNPALETLDSVIRSNSINFTIVSSLFLLVIVLISAVLKKPSEATKTVLFFASVFIILVNTLYLTGSTIYQNQLSITKGPIHWHADFQIWNCGEKVNLVDPTGWSNKIGTPLLHEHNDERVHVEGVVLRKEHASLGEFFKVIGGEIKEDSLSVPTNEGMITMKSGDTCNGNWGELQVFAYTTVNNVYSQKKLENVSEYILSPHSHVPPADCLIFEFDSKIKDKTDKICTFYDVAIRQGKIVGE